jgi:biotin carboxyl carrier protein
MRQFKYIINGNKYNVTVNKVEETTSEVEVNGVEYKVFMDKPVKKQAVTRPAQAITSQRESAPIVARPASTSSKGAIKSPLAGIILSIDCKIGDTIKKGQKLLVLEAMKMENTICSDYDGVVAAINVNTGDSVMEGADMVIIT